MRLVHVLIQSHYDGFDVTMEVTDEQYELLNLLSDLTGDYKIEPYSNDCYIAIVWEEQFNL